MSGRNSNLSRMVVKAMGLFSGVQCLSILCSVVRCKLVSMWIGPVGVGLFAIWNSALDMITTASNLGVRNSSVRDIASGVASGDDCAVTRIVAVVRRWSLWLGIAGALLTMALAPFLSHITFGDQEHIWGFVVLSVAVFMTSLMCGEQAVLQGTSQLMRLAKSSAVGTMSGLLISIPLYYFLCIDSVLPSVLVCSVCSAIASLHYRGRPYSAPDIPRRDVLRQGGEFIRLGVFMTVGVLLAIVSNYAFVAYLNWHGGAEEVGLYQASYTLANKYVSLVLSAFSMEYFPRLSRVADSRMRMRVFSSQEINISLAVLTPLVVTMIMLREVVVSLLYSQEFMSILTCFTWMLVGMVLRAISWCLSYVILARGDGKAYIITETLSVSVGLALNMIMYHRWGIDGLGVSFAIWYAVYIVIMLAVCMGKYKIVLHRGVWCNVFVSVAMSVGCAWAMEHDFISVAIFLSVASVVTCVALMRRYLRL